MNPFSPIFSSLANKIMEMKEANTDANFKFSDEDAMNTLIIFSAVVGNIFIHRMQEKNVSLEAGSNCAAYFGDKLSAMMKEFTGIDTKTYYSG